MLGGCPVIIKFLRLLSSNDINHKGDSIIHVKTFPQLSSYVTLSEAVRRARVSCKQSGDPSWLAYQLYGHPNSQVKLG